MKIARASLVVHTGKPRALELAEEIGARLREAGVAIDDDRPDLVVALGGDGTMLRAARLAYGSDALLLGVNLGALGYLTEVPADEAGDAVGRVLAGRHTIEQRMMLRCTAAGVPLPDPYVALNEVLVERTSGHRLVHLRVRIGGESLAGFNADGVIVATPTGSTAYALSAGGPIVSPEASCLILVPVSPHMIFSRPFVVAPDEEIEITVDGEGLMGSLSLDGDRGYDLPPGIAVVVKRAERPLRLVRLEGPGFLERLRAKLGLPG